MIESSGSPTTAVAAPFVGRGADLAELERILTQTASAGRGQVVAIGGEPGIGKTRLVAELTVRAEERGVCVRWSACAEGAPALWPWARAIRPLVDDDPTLRARLGASGAELDRLLLTAGEHDDEPVGTGETESARFRLYDAIARLLELAAAPQPLLVVLDDVHWADAPSLALLNFVARALSATPVVVVTTFRDTEIGPDLAATLGDLPASARRLVLTGLTGGETAALVTALSGRNATPEMGDTLVRQTQGNPLFVRELVDLLVAQDRLDAAGAELAALPHTVRAVIERRTARLSASCHEVLATAAVVGLEFDYQVLATAAAVDEPAVLALLDEAVTARFLVPTGVGRYSFSHDLVRRTLYDGLGVNERANRHRRVGDALEAAARAGASLEAAELARHFLAAAPGGDASRAVVHCTRAGEEALRRLAYEQAADHFQDAIEVARLAPSDRDREAELLLRLGDARVRSGAIEPARAAFLQAAEAARAVGDGPRLARAALGLGTGMGGFEITMADQLQLDLLDDALEELGERDSLLRAWLLARLSVALTGVDEDRRGRLAEDAVVIARHLGDERALAYALACHCDVIAGPAHTDRRVDQSTEIVGLARRTGDRELELLGRRLRLVALLERGAVAEVDAEIDAFARAAASLRQPLYDWYVPLWRGMRALMESRFDRCQTLLTEAESIGHAAGSANAAVLTWTLRAGMAYARDELAALVGEFEALIDSGSGPAGYGYTGPLALMLIRAGRASEGRALLDSLAVTELAHVADDSERLEFLCFAAEAVAALGHEELGALLYEQLAPYAGWFAVDGIGAACYGAVDRYLGLLATALGRRDTAERHFADALALHRGVGASLLVELTLRDRDAALGRGREDQAAVFQRTGDIWTLAYGGVTTQVKDAKGLRNLAALIARPGEMLHVRELLGAPDGGPAVAAAGADAVLDRRAVDEYRRRLRELEEEVEEADSHHDVERSARAGAERDTIVSELEAALGLGGRPRRLDDQTERVRKAVRARIRLTLDRLDREHPPLGRHLRAAVRTGTFCSYEPERLPDWRT